MLLRDGVREVLELLQEEWVLEDPLDGLDEVRLQGKAVLPLRVPRLQEVGQGCIAFACKRENKRQHPLNAERTASQEGLH